MSVDRISKANDHDALLSEQDICTILEDCGLISGLLLTFTNVLVSESFLPERKYLIIHELRYPRPPIDFEGSRIRCSKLY